LFSFSFKTELARLFFPFARPEADIPKTVIGEALFFSFLFFPFFFFFQASLHLPSRLQVANTNLRFASFFFDWNL